MQTCPRCTLISPDGATHCDCGFDLSTPLAEEQAEIKKREWDALHGVPIGLGLLVVAVVAAGSGHFNWALAAAGVGLVLASIKRVAEFRDAGRAIRDEAVRRSRLLRFRRR